jgi:putative methylase
MIKLDNLKILEKIELPVNPDASLEQYFTPPKIALDFISLINVKDKTVLDLASGPGVLGLAAFLCGAKKVFFVDVDDSAINLCKNNYSFLKSNKKMGKGVFLNKDISLLRKKDVSDVDIALLNPPFGTTDQNKKLDVVFLKKAMKLSNKVLTMHKTASKNFIRQIFKDSSFKIVKEKDFLFPIPKQNKHHEKPLVNIEVTLFVAEKINQ